MQLLALFLAPALLAQSPDAQGQAEFQAGRYRAAKKHFEHSLRLSQDSPTDHAVALANLAQAQLALGEVSAATGSLRLALDQMPHSGRLWNQYGQVLFTGRDFAAAEAAQRKALDLTLQNDPKTAATVLSDLALLYKERGKGQQAIDSLQRALQLLPPSHARARILANLGLLRWKFGPKSAAAGYLEQALTEMEQSVGPRHPDVGRILEDYSTVLARSGRKQAAKEMAARAHQIRAASLAQTNNSRQTIDYRDLVGIRGTLAAGHDSAGDRRSGQVRGRRRDQQR
ncbi:MAG: tetratricopeptide repeat protein [Bryobacteraceae bacterium]